MFFMLLVFLMLGIIAILGFRLVVTGAVKGAQKIENYYLNSDPDKLQADWNTRVQQLNIDLEKAIYVKYYNNYYQDKNIKAHHYVYLWAVEGAIAGFSTLQYFDDCGRPIPLANSPLEWNIIYMELKDIRGVFLRNDVCIIQFDDGSMGYPANEYAKIKKVYEDAKAMTN